MRAALLFILLTTTTAASAQECVDTAGALVTPSRRARALTASFDELRTTFTSDLRLAAGFDDSTRPEDLRFTGDGGIDFHPYGALLVTREGTSGYSACVLGADRRASIEISATSYVAGFEHAPSGVSVDARLTQHWFDVHTSVTDGLAVPVASSVDYARTHEDLLALSLRYLNLLEATAGVSWYQPLRFDPGAEPPAEVTGPIGPRWMVALGSPRLRLSQGLVFGAKEKPVEVAYLDVREYPLRGWLDGSAGVFYLADERQTYARLGAGLRPHPLFRFAADVAPEFIPLGLRYARAGGGFDLLGQSSIGKGRFAITTMASYFDSQYVRELKGQPYWGFDYQMLLEGRLRSMTAILDTRIALSSPEVLNLYPESAGSIYWRVMFYLRFGPGGL